jgi:hypothetical protein
MRLRIKLRHRDISPTPWRWEIFDDVTQKTVKGASHGYADRDEAYQDGQAVAAEIERTRE